uniref:Malate dehydrogenase, cytoplasmic n=1 Tax=Aotus nancymaae TaxID=37293 RepID=A0A2K5EQ81_AOTNA
RVLVTGATGQIVYSLLNSIRNRSVFDEDQPIIFVLLDVTPMMDCTLPLLKDVIATDKEEVSFKNLDVAFLVASMQRREGMEKRFTESKTLEKYNKKSVKVIVVGNPANTNCLTASKLAPSMPKENFSCLTSKAQIALQLDVTANDVTNVVIWGNHSLTQYPDVNHAKVKLQGKEVQAQGEFVMTMQQRGTAIIKARKLSRAMSAAKAICDHIRDMFVSEGEFVSMGVISDGNSYGIPDDLLCSFPVKFVEGLPINDFSCEKIDLTAKELKEEKETAFEFLSSA